MTSAEVVINWPDPNHIMGRESGLPFGGQLSAYLSEGDLARPIFTGLVGPGVHFQGFRVPIASMYIYLHGWLFLMVKYGKCR